MRYVIVSRHPAAVEFIRRGDPRFKDAVVIAEAKPEDVEGAVVAGNLPLRLACLAREVVAVEFDGAPPRGQEYSLEQMEAAGARLASYVVLRGTADAFEEALQSMGVDESDSRLEDVRDVVVALSAPDPCEDEGQE